jgi:hypothetical protein
MFCMSKKKGWARACSKKVGSLSDGGEKAIKGWARVWSKKVGPTPVVLLSTLYPNWHAMLARRVRQDLIEPKWHKQNFRVLLL